MDPEKPRDQNKELRLPLCVHSLIQPLIHSYIPLPPFIPPFSAATHPTGYK